MWRSSRWLLLAGAVVALLAWGLSMLDSPDVPREALDAAPAGASLVASVDVRALTASHVWRALLAEDEQEHGVRRVERVCGYDPLDEVEDAVIFVFGSDERPFEHIGFVARGELARGSENRQRLVRCVGDVVGGGGGVHRVEVEGETAVASSSGGSHAAFLGSDGIVGGDRAVVARVIRVARGTEPPARTDATLERLWSRVSHDRDIVAVAHLPERWIPALRRMSRMLDGDLGALAAVRALGVGARVRGGLSIGLAAETAGAPDAERLEALVHDQVGALLAEPLVRLSVFGRALSRLGVEAQGREVVVTLSLTDAQVDGMLALWRALRHAEPDGAAPRDAVPPSEGAAESDAPTDGTAASDAVPEAPSIESHGEPGPTAPSAEPPPTAAERASDSPPRAPARQRAPREGDSPGVEARASTESD